jgi:branched-chain amino acid transport system permease protein
MSSIFFLHHAILLGIYVILALSLNLINGYCGLFSLGHAGFMAVGAYSSAVCVNVLNHAFPEILNSAPLLFLGISLLIGFAMASCMGLLIGLPCMRLKGDYLAIATLAFGEIIHQIIINSQFLGGTKGYEIQAILVVKQSRTQCTNILGMDISNKLLYHEFFVVLVALGVLFTFFLIQNLMHSAHGRSIHSIREDELAANLLGIHTVKYKLLTFFLGSGLAGFAGALYAQFMRLIGPTDFDLMKTVTLLLMVVLGGMRNQYGIILATFILYSIPEILRADLLSSWITHLGFPPFFTTPVVHFSKILSSGFQIVYALLLIGLMLWRPQGIFGKRKY